MPTGTLISVEHYLDTSYSSYRDYIVCCEVLFRSDTMREMLDRCNDDLKFGVQHVWVFDLLLQEAIICDAKGFHTPESERLVVPGTAIHLPLPQIFAELD